MVVGIAGAGTMGVGIATIAAQAGDSVVLYDVSEEQLKNAITALRKNFSKAAEKKVITETEIEAALLRCSFITQLSQLEHCDLVIEAAPESYEIKFDLFRNLERWIRPDALLATNTSSLSVNRMAGKLEHPARFFGLHFFNPVPLMKLVEVIPGMRSDASLLPRLTDQVKLWGKLPVIAKDSPGFIVNRVARPYYGEALRIASESIASIEQTDRMLRAAGFKMGPFELMDLIGIDTNFAATCSVYEGFFHEPRFRPHPMQQAMVDAGLLGRKTGRGFYDYSEKK